MNLHQFRRMIRAGAAGAMLLLASGAAPFPLAAQRPAASMSPDALDAPYESDILTARPIRYYLGAGAGVTAFQHLGDFSPSCDCRFSGAKGVRSIYAVEFSIRYPKLGFGLKNMISYQDFSADFSRRSVRMSVVAGDNPDIEVEYENTASVTLRYLSLTSMFAWYFPFTQLFLAAGVELGYPVGRRYDHVERILTPGVQYYDGSTANTLLPAQDIPGAGSPRVGIAVAAGLDIIVSPSVAVTPQLGAAYPLTSVTTEDADWKVLSEYGMLFLKIRL